MAIKDVLDFEGLSHFTEKMKSFVTAITSKLETNKLDKTTVATSSILGLVKSGTDITVDTSGNVSVKDNSHKHTVSNISDLTATASELNVLDGITASTAELNYTDGVTSNIQTQLNSKQPNITGGATTITSNNLTASRALISNSSGKVAVSDVTSTELGYLDGVTSNIQTQLNAKAPLASPTLTGTPKAPTATAGTNSTQIATTAFVQTAVSNLVDSAPETLDTLGEIADALKDNADIVDVLNDSIATKANTSDLTSHTSNTTVHITATERTNWNDANSKKHTHSNKSILDSTTASYTTADKTKLGGIATGAEVNQNAFSNVVVGSTTIAADSKTDSLTLAGSNVTITPDATNDKVTIGITKANVTSALGYTPPTTNTTYGVATSSTLGLVKSGTDITVDTSGNVSVNSVSGSITGTNPTIQDSTNAPLIYGKFKGYTLQDGEPAPDNPIEINGLAKDGVIEVKTTGKNLFNKDDVLNGLIVNTGKPNTQSSTYKHAIIKVEPNQKYTRSRHDGNNFGGGYDYAFFDKNNEFISVMSGAGNGATHNTFTTPDDCYYLYLNTTTEYMDYLQLEKGEVSNPIYKPYQETTTAITTDAPLYEGDYLEVYADGSGKVVKKMGSVVFDGSIDEKWNMVSSDNGRRFVMQYFAQCADKTNTTKSSHFVKSNQWSWLGMPNLSVLNAENAIGFKYFELSTLDEWKSWLQSNPVTVVYELAKPTETPLTAEQVAQFKKLYTFEPVTNVLCDGETEIQYYKNTPGGVAISTVHRMANDDKATYDGKGNVIADTYATKNHGTHVTYGTSASALGTSSAGSATTVSRSDHVHALPALTSCTGTLSVAKGGTGATDAATARTNLGITPANIGAATSSHTHSSYVNQNAFSNVTVGSATISADTTTDTLTLAAGSNVTITPDATNDKITISSSHPTISKSTNTTSTASPSAGGTFTAIDSITQDSNGHVTKFNTKTVTLPSTSITVDSALSSTSTNPVQNKVINTALAGKANSSHGTHVSYSSTKPVMDGTASVGSANTVAKSDHRHPTDTSRASTSSVLSTVSECTASTNSKDIASASALAELNNSLTTTEIFNVVGIVEGFAPTDYCIFNKATKQVKIVCQCTCYSCNTTTALCRVPERFIPSSNVPILTHMINGTQVSNVGGLYLAASNGYIYQSLTGGLTSTVFELEYYL